MIPAEMTFAPLSLIMGALQLCRGFRAGPSRRCLAVAPDSLSFYDFGLLRGSKELYHT